MTGGQTARHHVVSPRLWLGVAAASLGLLALAMFLHDGGMIIIACLVAAGVLGGGAAGYLLATRAYRRDLENLHAGLVSAQDGNLHPVPVPETRDPQLLRLYQDYNQTITTLGAMFSLVEECQHRVLNERNRMNVMVQVLPAALLGVDDNLCVNIVNKQAETLFRTEERYLVGSSLFDILNLTEEAREVLRDAFLYKLNIRNQVVNLQLHDQERWVSMNLSFVTEDGEEMAAVITLLDITDYRQLQESVYTREKLVAMGQLAAGVAHELNTPLGSILGYSRLLLDACENPGRARHYSRIIADETKRCSRIIQNLLNYARKDQCQGDICEVNAVVDEVIDTLISCRLKRYAITLERDYQGHPVVDGSCGEIEIVLTNLLVNAVQALQGVEDPVIRVRTREAEGGFVSIVVEDNGPGIPREMRARVFEPFFSTKEVGDGSGLGLSISHAMVSRRGGTLRYDGDYNEGARFVIRLPGTGAARQSLQNAQDVELT